MQKMRVQHVVCITRLGDICKFVVGIFSLMLMREFFLSNDSQASVLKLTISQYMFIVY